MRRDLYVYSTLNNGTTTKIFLKKSFEVRESFVPPLKGFIVHPGYLLKKNGELGDGVITDVTINGRICTDQGVAFEEPMDVLRAYFIPEGWKEEFYGQLD